MGLSLISTEKMFENSLFIALGGALGTLARFWVTEACLKWFGADFPWGTVLVNISGCAVIGFFGVLTATDGRFAVPVVMRQFVIIGICGGYTTFSAFSLQTFAMINRGAWGTAAAHIIGSVALCLLAVWAGAAIAGAVVRE